MGNEGMTTDLTSEQELAKIDTDFQSWYKAHSASYMLFWENIVVNSQDTDGKKYAESLALMYRNRL